MCVRLQTTCEYAYVGFRYLPRAEMRDAYLHTLTLTHIQKNKGDKYRHTVNYIT